MSWMYDFYNLLLPELCPVCKNVLMRNEGIICTSCNYNLPRTRFRCYQNNPVSQLFWGRVMVENANAYFHYQKGSLYQHLIRDLKYHGRTDIGIAFGRMMGDDLRGSDFTSADLILPVPLHPRKKRERGYNQSDFIAAGLSECLGIPYHTDLLVRSAESLTQTHQSRVQRWQNVENIFSFNDPASIENLHILLVDDVVTTGATLEACSASILGVNGARVSIATIGFTGRLF